MTDENTAQVSDIDTFFNKNTRAENDITNRKRENVLTNLSNPEHPFLSDPTYGTKWTTVRTAFVNYINTHINCPSYNRFEIEHKGGLNSHHDHNLMLYKDDKLLKTIKLEFKNNNMPQFMQEYDSKKWTTITLAEFWYDEGWLDLIIALYPQPLKYLKPSREEYLKSVNQLLGAKSKPSFFKQFYDFDHDPKYKKQSKEKDKITKDGIAAFLAKYGKSFDVPKLSAKCKIDQVSKVYLIWKPAKKIFECYEITEEELNPTAISSVTKNTVILEAGKSKLKCLLRWKNTLGLCCPAWQISLHRTKK